MLRLRLCRIQQPIHRSREKSEPLFRIRTHMLMVTAEATRAMYRIIDQVGRGERRKQKDLKNKKKASSVCHESHALKGGKDVINLIR